MFRPLSIASAVLMAGLVLSWWLRPAAPKPAQEMGISAATAAPAQTPMQETAQSLPAARPYSSSPTPAPAPGVDPNETPEKKVARLKQALVKDPENPQLLYELGLTLARDLHAPEDGIPHLEKSIKNDSGNGNVFYDLVGAYLESGNSDRGIKFLDDLTRMDNTNRAATYAALADLRAASGDPVSATADVQRAHAEDPHSPAVSAMAASISMQVGDTQNAEQMSKLAIEQQLGKMKEKRDQGLAVEADQLDLDQIMRGYADVLAQSRRVDELRRLSTSASSAVKSHINQLLQQGGGG
jgi:predicted Zn-dependent protease